MNTARAEIDRTAAPAAPDAGPLLAPAPCHIARLPAGETPKLVVIIDTEEEFDWSKPHARGNTSVETISAQVRAQEIFARHDVVPTYVIDYPVASDDRAVGHLREFQDAGVCEIGAHLHPWVNPPHDETVTAPNTYPGNLDAALEAEKLKRLTACIAEQFGRAPTVYKAGRYGIGPNTQATLQALGYQVDASIVPHTAFCDDGGPDFRAYGFMPYWFGEGLLELPLACGFHGLLRGAGTTVYPRLAGRLGLRLHAPGVLARLGLMERIRLTPEGVDICAMKRLTRSLLAQGCEIFCLTYHSPSLEIGYTPYVTDKHELDNFLYNLECYINFFRREIGGNATTPRALHATLRGAPWHVSPRA